MSLSVPGRVLRIRSGAQGAVATVDVSGVTREVALRQVPDVVVGDFVLVYGGEALARMDEDAAIDALAHLETRGIRATGIEDPAGQRGESTS